MLKTTSNAGRIIINTVGASLLSNLGIAPRSLKRFALEKENSIAESELEEVLAALKAKNQKKAAIEALLKVITPVYADPTSQLVCAEVSFLSAINVNPQDKLFFLAGTTEEEVANPGEVCGRTLTEYYNRQNIEAEFVPVPGFVIDDAQSMERPEIFPQILDKKVSELREQNQDAIIILNLTGGYKLGVLYGTLVGLIYGCQINYLHEGLRRPLGLPSAEEITRLNQMLKVITLQQYERMEQGEKDLYYLEGENYHLIGVTDIITRFSKNWYFDQQVRVQRKLHLEGLIAEAYELQHEYEAKLLVEDDPKRRRNSLAEIEGLKKQISGYEKELKQIEAR